MSTVVSISFAQTKTQTATRHAFALFRLSGKFACDMHALGNAVILEQAGVKENTHETS